MKFKIDNKVFTKEEIVMKYADDACKRNGWRIGSPAWKLLCDTNDANDNFLINFLNKLYPNSKIEMEKN